MTKPSIPLASTAAPMLQGASSINPEVRKEAYSAAIKRITEQAN